jgi:modulator of FtsH protease
MEGGAGWSDFLVASAGATAALAGLVFVALSINLGKILALEGVTERAGETILLLASGLVGSLAALIPHETKAQLGLWLLILWCPTWVVPTIIQIRDFANRRYYRAYQAAIRFLLYQSATTPLLLAGLSLRGHLDGGLIWLALGLILSLIVALYNAWVLLVEILR